MIREESKSNQTKRLVSQQDGPDKKTGFELKTYSVAQIMQNFMPKCAAPAFDPKSYSVKKFVNGSVSFGVWLCLLPAMTTWWAIQGLFNLQVQILRTFVLTFFPDLKEDIQSKTVKAYEQTKEAVEPVVESIKSTAIR